MHGSGPTSVEHLNQCSQQDGDQWRSGQPEEIEHKLKSYLHHREFDENPIPESKIFEIIKNKRAIYNLKTDKRLTKFGEGDKLEKYPIEKLPKFLQNNLKNYKEWID